MVQHTLELPDDVYDELADVLIAESERTDIERSAEAAAS